jgi:phosphonate degradation associated HDIG domain protein
MNEPISQIIKILSTEGHQQYGGEEVTQLEHALQCATLAEMANASKKLIAACLLHDLGHLIHNLGENYVKKSVDDCHEYRVLGILCPIFPAAVTEPIRLHVEAKRYLCQVSPNYYNSLSPTSQMSLNLQGGIFSSVAAEHFIKQPYAEDGVQLRRWDDQAKIPHLLTPDLFHFIPILKQVILS